MSKILVAGIGNKYYGDDSFGPRVIEALIAKNLPEDVEARDVGLCGSTLAPDLGDYELVIFVDAVMKGGKPGTIYRTEIKADQVKELRPEDVMQSFTFSIHDTGLEQLLSFAKKIGTLPPTTIVFGCEILEITLGETLSRAVEAAVRSTVELIFAELQRYRERK
jgi:hydrogenase maturation protease